MLKKINPLLAIIFSLVVLPSLAYSVWQFSRFTELENEVNQVYKNQLKTVLFSLNTYSDDYITGVFSEIESAVKKNKQSPEIKAVIAKRDFINSVVISYQPDFINAEVLAGTDKVLKSVTDKAQQLSTQLRRLPFYLDAGYSKKESAVDSVSAVIFFAFRDNNGKTIFSAVSILLPVLYKTMLGPKMASEEFKEYLVVISTAGHEFFRNSATSPKGKLEIKKEAVFFPGVMLSIKPLGKIFEQVIVERTRSNIILLIALNITLFTAVFVIYRTTKKQTELAQQKSEFVANVSHELRTPLSLIRMFAETLADNRINDENKKHKYYKMIVSETERLTLLINSVLSFSGLESGKRTFTKNTFRLDELLREILAGRETSLTEKGFNVSLEITGEDFNLEADRNAITEVILNLIDNAEKYSPETKEIKLSLHKSSDNIIFRIEDKGLGIPEKYSRKIFEKFFRIPTGDVHNVKGTGLGLSIVKQIVAAHNGDIKVFSKPGAGSRFEIIFKVS